MKREAVSPSSDEVHHCWPSRELKQAALSPSSTVHLKICQENPQCLLWRCPNKVFPHFWKWLNFWLALVFGFNEWTICQMFCLHVFVYIHKSLDKLDSGRPHLLFILFSRLLGTKWHHLTWLRSLALTCCTSRNLQTKNSQFRVQLELKKVLLS